MLVLKSFEENDIAYFGVATDCSNYKEPEIISYDYSIF